MKITQLFKIYWPDNGGGIAKVIESIADGFSDCEQEIIVCQDNRHKQNRVDQYNGIRVYRCSQLFTFASTPISFHFLRSVKKRTMDSDITIYHFPYPMIDIAVLLGLYSGKLVVWWHCGIEKYKRLLPLYRPLVKHTLQKADRILVSARGNIEHSDILKQFQNKCSVIPYCVGGGYLAKGRESMQKTKQPKECINILFVGRLVWYKGCDVLLKAFAKMQKKDGVKCRLVLVGGGPLAQELKKLALALNLRSVEFTGMVSEEEKMRQIEACDFLVLPSVSQAEAFGLVQLEAMAFGKPVINTRLPSGVPHVSIHGVTGITVEPNHIGQLAAAMQKLAADDKLRQKYGRNAFNLVNEEYTGPVMIRRHREVFSRLL